MRPESRATDPGTPATPDPAAFREAMAGFPSGVVIAVARDAAGTLRGFTASAFCSVSLDPPTVLVCYARGAESAPAFEAAAHVALSVLRPEHEDLARLFATRGADKFGDSAAFEPAPHGLATVAGALAALVCRVTARHTAGDHTILVGEVTGLHASAEGEAMLHFRRRFLGAGGGKSGGGHAVDVTPVISASGG